MEKLARSWDLPSWGAVDGTKSASKMVILSSKREKMIAWSA